MRSVLFISLLISSVLLGCSTAALSKPSPSLENVLAVSIGSKSEEVFRRLGKADKVEKTTAGSIWTYTVRYKKWNLPRTIIQFDKDGFVVDEHINIIKQLGDQITLEELKTKLVGVNPIATPDDLKLHYISPTAMYHDTNFGLSAEVKKHNGEVLWLSRHKPRSDSKTVTAQ